MRGFVALTPAAVVLATMLVLPSCSDDPSSPATDGGVVTGDATPMDPPHEGGLPGDGSVASADYRAGTRLHPIFTTGGGARLFDRLHDSQLDTDCSYAKVADGTLRCLPTSPRSGSVYFTDPSCAQKIVAWQATCAPSTPDKYAVYTNFEVGCATPEVLELDVASAPATTYEMNSGACVAYAGAALTYRSVTRTVPPSELVAATVSREPRGKQLFNTHYEGADGSRQLFGVEDGAPHAGPCDAAKAGDGTLRCAPTNLAFIESLYSEATCTTPAAYRPGYTSASCNTAPVAILESANGVCAGTNAAKYYDVGAKVSGPIYQGSPASCSVAASLGAGSTFYAKGAAIPDSALAALKRVPSAGTPLGVDVLAVDSGEELRATSFWDPARNAPCRAGKASDGKTRCVGSPGDSPTFADASCVQALAVVYHAAAGCMAPVPTHIWTLTAGVNICAAGTVRGFTVGGKVTPAQIYSGSSCTPIAPDTVNADYYATTAEIAPTDLVELTEVTE